MTTPRVTDAEIQRQIDEIRCGESNYDFAFYAANLLERILDERQAEKGEAVAWLVTSPTISYRTAFMDRFEAECVVDAHAREGWSPRLIPLYTHPPKQREVTDGDLEKAKSAYNDQAKQLGYISHSCDRDCLRAALSSLQEPKK